METDITLVFLKYLIKYNRLNIETLDSLDVSRFPGSNIHKLVTNLCVNYINLRSEILSKDLQIFLKMYRDSLVHCEGSVSGEKIKAGIMAIIREIAKLDNVHEYKEKDYMMY